MFRETLKRTRKSVFGRIANVLGATEIDDETWEEIEALLIQSDLGVETSVGVVNRLRSHVLQKGYTSRDELLDALKSELRRLLIEPNDDNLQDSRLLSVLLIVGVNGSGKTTTIAKLGRMFVAKDHKVAFAAGDTFRAAAADQLKLWGERLDIPVFAGQMGGDPGAVVYDAIRAARARERDLLIIDTAGRLHTSYNLMAELKKIYSVARKNVHEAPHEVWLVIDGTTGQNALEQARHFKDAVGVSGVIVTKLDGSARGGIVFAINQKLGLPIRYIGTGESEDDLIAFDPDEFVNSLFE